MPGAARDAVPPVKFRSDPVARVGVPSRPGRDALRRVPDVASLSLVGLLVYLGICAALVVAIYVGSIVREALHPVRATTAWALARGLPASPGDLGLDFREWSLERGRTGRRSVWEIDLSGGQASQTHVLLLHGWGRSKVDMLSRLGPFLDRADRIVLMDFRGHGESEGRATLGDGDEEDVAALVERLPPGPVLLVGHSLGATVAIRAAGIERIRSRIAGVVAIAPYARLLTPIANRLRLRGLPSLGAARLAVGILGLLGRRPESTLEAVGRLSCPLLVLHGDDDRIAPPADGRAIAEAGRGRFERFSGVAHAGHERADPQRFESLCRRLLPTPE